MQIVAELLKQKDKTDHLELKEKIKDYAKGYDNDGNLDFKQV
jgi:hypothetical protein